MRPLLKRTRSFFSARLFQNFVFDGGKLSPDHIGGKGVNNAVERANDLKQRPNAFPVVDKKLVEADQAQHQISSCGRSHEPDTTRARGGRNDVRAGHRKLV